MVIYSINWIALQLMKELSNLTESPLIELKSSHMYTPYVIGDSLIPLD